MTELWHHSQAVQRLQLLPPLSLTAAFRREQRDLSKPAQAHHFLFDVIARGKFPLTVHFIPAQWAWVVVT